MRRLILIITLIGLMASAYCQKPTNYDDQLKGMYKNTIELISVEDLSKEIETNKGIVLLDARELNEFKVCHIEGAWCVGYDKFSIEIMEDIPKDSEIVVYCSLGVRSEQVGEKLKEAGYLNVKNLFGGIFEWKYLDQEVVDKKGNPTNKVHTYNENWSKWLLKGEKVY